MSLQSVERFLDGTGRIRVMPAKRRARLEMLAWLVNDFETSVRYSEASVNAILQVRHADYAALRRYLVDEGMLGRDNAGIYWRIPDVESESSSEA